MPLLRLADLIEVLAASLELLDPLLGESSALDGLKLTAHAVFHRFVDDLGANRDIAIFRRLRDGETHPGNSTLVHEIHDELELVQALEVGHLGRVAGFHQHFEPSLHQGGGPPAEDALLTEEVGHGLLPEVGLEDARPRAPDALGPGEGGLPGLPGRVIMDRDQGGHSLFLEILAAHGMARALWCDHDDVHVPGSINQVEVNREPMGEKEGLARGQVRGHVLLENRGNDGVRSGDENDIGVLNRFTGIHHLEPELLGDRTGLGLGVESDRHVATTLLEVQGVGMPLGTESNDGELLALDRIEVGVLVSIDLGGHDGMKVVDFPETGGRRLRQRSRLVKPGGRGADSIPRSTASSRQRFRSRRLTVRPTFPISPAPTRRRRRPGQLRAGPARCAICRPPSRSQWPPPPPHRRW